MKEIHLLSTLKNTLFSDAFGQSSNNLHEYINSCHTGTSQFVPKKNVFLVLNNLFQYCCGAIVSKSTSANRIFIEETSFTTCKTTAGQNGWGVCFTYVVLTVHRSIKRVTVILHMVSMPTFKQRMIHHQKRS